MNSFVAMLAGGLSAGALIGVLGSTPIRVCTDACGQRIGCDFVSSEAEPKPADCPAPPPVVAVAKPDTRTICFDGIYYFERTLTPVYDTWTGKPAGC